MKINKIISLTIAASMCALSLCSCAVHNAPDDNTSAVSPSQPTIAATSVAICEILDSIGYDNVIGIPASERELPDRYKNATRIGAPMNPDLEIIKSIDPDYVLSPKTLEASLAPQYSAAGVSSAFLDLASVEGMYAGIGSLGKLLGKEAEAETLIDEYRRYLDGYTAEDGPSALLLMAFPDGFFLVASEESYVGNLVKLAGGKNVYADYEGDQEGFINVNPEDMVQKNRTGSSYSPIITRTRRLSI